MLNIRHGAFDPLGERDYETRGLTTDVSSNLYIVQFVTQPLEEFRQSIEALGGTVYPQSMDIAHLPTSWKLRLTMFNTSEMKSEKRR